MRKRIATSLDVSLMRLYKDTDLMQWEWYAEITFANTRQKPISKRETQVLFMNILEPIVHFSVTSFQAPLYTVRAPNHLARLARSGDLSASERLFSIPVLLGTEVQ